MNFNGLKKYSELIPKIQDTIDYVQNTGNKFERCMKRAKWICPRDFGAQTICGNCQLEAENKCRVDLFLDTGKDIVTPWWLG